MQKQDDMIDCPNCDKQMTKSYHSNGIDWCWKCECGEMLAKTHLTFTCDCGRKHIIERGGE